MNYFYNTYMENITVDIKHVSENHIYYVESHMLMSINHIQFKLNLTHDTSKTINAWVKTYIIKSHTG